MLVTKRVLFLETLRLDATVLSSAIWAVHFRLQDAKPQSCHGSLPLFVSLMQTISIRFARKRETSFSWTSGPLLVAR